MQAEIGVTCSEAREGWRCDVDVKDELGASRHTVTVYRVDLARLDPRASDPERLVRVSFAFLLKREGKASILGRFDLVEIGRYFPEYEREIVPWVARVAADETS